MKTKSKPTKRNILQVDITGPFEERFEQALKKYNEDLEKKDLPTASRSRFAKMLLAFGLKGTNK